jgi:putative transcriptional regulator
MVCILFWLTVALPAAAAVAPEAGLLLVARPELPDPRFREAVILLVQHGPAGSAGLILNRPSRLALAEVLPELPAATGPEGLLSYGGPVAPRDFMVLVRAQGEPPEPSQKVIGNVYLTGTEQFAAWLDKNCQHAAYRVFAGYGGWSPGQLEKEMVRGDWQLLSADEQTPFVADMTGLWQALAGRTTEVFP